MYTEYHTRFHDTPNGLQTVAHTGWNPEQNGAILIHVPHCVLFSPNSVQPVSRSLFRLGTFFISKTSNRDTYANDIPMQNKL